MAESFRIAAGIQLNEEKLMKLMSEIDYDKIAEKTITAGTDIVYPAFYHNLDEVIGKDIKYTPSRMHHPSELLTSSGVSPVKRDRAGDPNAKVGFSEPRREQTEPKYWHKNRKGQIVADRQYYTVTNALIANVIEYGKSGQPAKPFIKRAMAETEEKCKKAMADVYDEELGKVLK